MLWATMCAMATIPLEPTGGNCGPRCPIREELIRRAVGLALLSLSRAGTRRRRSTLDRRLSALRQAQGGTCGAVPIDSAPVMESDPQDIFVELGGQDDNLGDSALRAGYLEAARGEGRRFHLFLGQQSADYVSGLPLAPTDQVYVERAAWIAASQAARRPVHLFNAGEIVTRSGCYPLPGRSAELRQVVHAGGALIVAGVGLRDPEAAISLEFHPVFSGAALVSWRDTPSCDAAGFGEVAPDWAFALGSPTSDWTGSPSRPLLAVTLRFDRAWPEPSWLEAVRAFAANTSTRIVTVAQVARDAPRAVRLAEALGGEYLVAPSTSHRDLGAHVRSVYGQSLAVITDRAHGLVIGATEGAYPIGSASHPEKLSRTLAVVGLEGLVGSQAQLGEVAALLESRMPGLAPAVDAARTALDQLRLRIQTVISAAA